MKIKKFDSINVIPFIDVLLVLLAIVLMTSTFIAKGVIPISLPKASSSVENKVVKEINIVIKSDGILYLDKLHISIEALKTKIKNLDKSVPVLIHSDKNAKFEKFVSVLDILKTNQIQNISIVTKK